jgi:hypothetical protein
MRADALTSRPSDWPGAAQGQPAGRAFIGTSYAYEDIMNTVPCADCHARSKALTRWTAIAARASGLTSVEEPAPCSMRTSKSYIGLLI